MTAPAAIVTPLSSMIPGQERSAPGASLKGQPISALTSGLEHGDEDAFREFHRRYFDRLLRYLFVVTCGHEDAARDALQETFTRVARHARVFDSEEKFWSWLTVLARSAARDANRKETRHWRLLARYAFLWRSVEEQPGPDASQLDETLAAAMDVLETTDRALIEGKYFRDLDVRTLAREFGLSEKAVESRLTRARRALRQTLSKQLRDES